MRRNTLLEEALEAWEDARGGIVAELENLPPERWDFRPTPEVRSVAELAAHILEVAQLMVGELTREDTDFQRLPWPELLELHAGEVRALRDREELLEALDSTLAEGQTRFREVGELHMLERIVRFDGQRGTRLAWLHHGIAQEMYHRGQLALYARLMGVVPALTQRIRAATEEASGEEPSEP